MNRFHFVALVLILAGIALRNVLGDGFLSIAIGLGVAFTMLGLFETYRRKV